MFNYDQLTNLIIKSALEDLQMLSDDAVQLLLFTCATESLGGTYIKQIKGPALGIYQMEPATYNDIWANYITPKNTLFLKLLSNFGCAVMPSEDRMIYDLRFATAMARLFYSRYKEPLPDKNNVNAIWEYYKKYWNTNLGAAKKETSIALYKQFIQVI